MSWTLIAAFHECHEAMRVWPLHYVGLDVSLNQTSICVADMPRFGAKYPNFRDETGSNPICRGKQCS